MIMYRCVQLGPVIRSAVLISVELGFFGGEKGADLITRN